jgi:hypothetical protein
MAEKILPEFLVAVPKNIADFIPFMLPLLGQEVNHG